MIETVPVALGGRAYEVLIGPGLIDQAGARIAPFLKRKRLAVVSDETVWGLHGSDSPRRWRRPGSRRWRW